MNKKALIPMTILATLAIPGIARANPSTASATCQGGIVYSGYDYPSAGNTVTVKIDGNTVAGYPKTFGSATSGTVPFPNKTSGHTWAVIWDRYNGTDGDRTQSGTVAACQTVPTTTTAQTTTVASSTTVAPTTTASPATSAPTTTVAVTTTSVVDVCCVVVPSTVALVPPVTIAAGVAEEPVLPRTGLDGTIILVAAILVIGGVFLVLRGRRVR